MEVGTGVVVLVGVGLGVEVWLAVGLGVLVGTIVSVTDGVTLALTGSSSVLRSATGKQATIITNKNSRNHKHEFQTQLIHKIPFPLFTSSILVGHKIRERRY